jgi:pentafunctional AROM polypeptide
LTLTALVVGAGGTARAAIYALHRAGFQTIYLYNRTVEKAQALARTFPTPEFNVVPVASLLPESITSAPAAIVSTVPAEGTTTDLDNKTLGAGVVLPRSIFSRAQGGVTIDMAYKPHVTPLLSLGRAQGWRAIPGIQILLEQGTTSLGSGMAGWRQLEKKRLRRWFGRRMASD